MPTAPRRPITVALLGTPSASAATLYGFFDLLSGTRRLLLVRTGLLDGEEATSHWTYCDLLARS